MLEFDAITHTEHTHTHTKKNMIGNKSIAYSWRGITMVIVLEMSSTDIILDARLVLHIIGARLYVHTTQNVAHMPPGALSR